MLPRAAAVLACRQLLSPKTCPIKPVYKCKFGGIADATTAGFLSQVERAAALRRAASPCLAASSLPPRTPVPARPRHARRPRHVGTPPRAHRHGAQVLSRCPRPSSQWTSSFLQMLRFWRPRRFPRRSVRTASCRTLVLRCAAARTRPHEGPQHRFRRRAHMHMLLPCARVCRACRACKRAPSRAPLARTHSATTCTASGAGGAEPSGVSLSWWRAGGPRPACNPPPVSPRPCPID